MKKKILIIAAHPDDEVLGCGGTIARLTRSGYEAFTLILGEGITSRVERRDSKQSVIEVKKLKEQTIEANKIIGVKKVFLFDFADNRFDTVPLLEIVKCIERVKNEISPSIVFTHSENDLNIDHRITYNAVLTATRPFCHETVKYLYSFEVLSSTEWGYPLSFSPDTYFDITGYLDIKIKALKSYKTEIRNYLHPRSVVGVKINAQYRGMAIGLKFAEAFKVVRTIQ